MLHQVGERLQNFFSKWGQKKFTEENLKEAIKEARLSLLEADVSYKVSKVIVDRVKTCLLGQEALKTTQPGEQFIKALHDELILIMGKEENKLLLKGELPTIMLCGLQGMGKTTQAAKLAYLLKNKYRKSPLLVALDLRRPAATDQLKILGEKIGVPVFSKEGAKDPVSVLEEAKRFAKEKGHDVLLLDTAGRLHIDEEMMKELILIKSKINPSDILFVASAALGQEALDVIKAFDDTVSITGVILTMLDGEARAGVALSLLEVTGRPILFEGVGEKIEDLQIFNPTSMADRVLGMGDVINLVKRAEEHFGEEEREKLEKKMKKASFTFEDYLSQMKMVKKMGSLKGLLKMVPGLQGKGDIDFDASNQEMKKMESMILSMTPLERGGSVELEPSRRRRIASGSGRTIDDVNRMIKGFKRLKSMMKQMPMMERFFKKKGVSLPGSVQKN